MCTPQAEKVFPKTIIIIDIHKAQITTRQAHSNFYPNQPIHQWNTNPFPALRTYGRDFCLLIWCFATSCFQFCVNSYDKQNSQKQPFLTASGLFKTFLRSKLHPKCKITSSERVNTGTTLLKFFSFGAHGSILCYFTLKCLSLCWPWHIVLMQMEWE